MIRAIVFDLDGTLADTLDDIADAGNHVLAERGLPTHDRDAYRLLIGEGVGRWPLYDDSADGLRRLMAIAPCAALTNSDRAHGEQVQEQLGFRLSHWLCAEESGFYKPDARAWRTLAGRLGIEPGPGWWHVSAYADYDLAVAARLGLTSVFVARPHARPGAATHEVPDLHSLAERLEGARAG